MFDAILFCFMLLFGSRVDGKDPCNAAHHMEFPDIEFGSRNEKCEPVREGLCDYYLQTGYYVVKAGTLLNHCPATGACGVSYPAWMNGDFPDATDGLVNRTACIRRAGDCCKDHVNIKVKNCTGFYVYHLRSLKECTSAYCLESSQSCVSTTTSSTSTDSENTTLKQNPHRDLKVIEISIASGVGVILILVIVIIVILYKHNGLKCKRSASTAPEQHSVLAPSKLKQNGQKHVESSPPPYSETKPI